MLEANAAPVDYVGVGGIVTLLLQQESLIVTEGSDEATETYGAVDPFAAEIGVRREESGWRVTDLATDA